MCIFINTLESEHGTAVSIAVIHYGKAKGNPFLEMWSVYMSIAQIAIFGTFRPKRGARNASCTISRPNKILAGRSPLMQN